MTDLLIFLRDAAGGSAPVVLLAAVFSLTLVVVGQVRGWYVPRGQHRDCERRCEDLTRDRDWWRDHAMRGIAFAERAIESPGEADG